MDGLPTKEEMRLMKKYKIRKIVEEYSDRPLYKWQVKCATRGCDVVWCLCTEDLDVAIREVSDNQKAPNKDKPRCTHHDRDIIAEAKEDWISDGKVMPWKEFLDEWIFDNIDHDGDFGDFSFCSCDA